MARHFKESAPESTPAQPKQVTQAYIPYVAQGYGAEAVKKRRSKRDLFSTALLVVGVALLLVAGGMWGFAQWRYHKQAVNNQKLAEYATVFDEPDETGEMLPPVVDWEGLKALNPEVCGWLQIPGTTINYPVYQASDNDKYLRHSATGEFAWGGQLFLDYECTWPGMADQVSLVYGHHLNDGSMFEQIARMDEQERFDAIETIWYVTEQNTYELEPLFLYYTQETDTDARTFNFSSVEEFRTEFAARLARAVTARDDASAILSTTEHVLVLATCNYYDGYGRTLLVCVPKSEAGTTA